MLTYSVFAIVLHCLPIIFFPIIALKNKDEIKGRVYHGYALLETEQKSWKIVVTFIPVIHFLLFVPSIWLTLTEVERMVFFIFFLFWTSIMQFKEKVGISYVDIFFCCIWVLTAFVHRPKTILTLMQILTVFLHTHLKNTPFWCYGSSADIFATMTALLQRRVFISRLGHDLLQWTWGYQV